MAGFAGHFSNPNHVILTAGYGSGGGLQCSDAAAGFGYANAENHARTCAFLLGTRHADALFDVSVAQLQDSHTVNAAKAYINAHIDTKISATNTFYD